MDTGNQQLVTKEQTSFTELLDQQEAIILDLENLHYYTLNAAAAFLWKQLRANAAQAEELSAALSAAFSLNAEQAELDTRVFLDELTRHGLISFAVLEPKERLRSSIPLKADSLPAYQPPELKASSSLSQVTLATISGGP